MPTKTLARIQVRAYSASFRIPGLMGYQLTSPVPPPSTVYGLIAAACGREVTPEECPLAYRFDYEALGEDLEKILFFGEKGFTWNQKLSSIGSGVVTRQFLINPCLTLYVPIGDISEALLRPRFPILLGRSQDVAYVASIDEATLEKVENGHVAGVILPFPIRTQSRSRLMAFPTFYPLGAKRHARAVKPFHVFDALDKAQHVEAGILWRDEDTGDIVPFFDAQALS